MRNVLIAGAGIAGPALAYWLGRAGIRTTVLERSAALRYAGQNVDVRGAGREVIRRMGLEDRVRAANTGERGVAFIDEAGRTRASLGVDDIAGGEGFTAELEILRGQFAELLYEHSKDTTEYVFGEHITGIEQPAGPGAPARVRLAGGGEREADVVVGADGIGSATRRMTFGDADAAGNAFFRPLNLAMAYLTIPREPGDGAWARWQNLPGARSVLLRPDNVGTTRALMSFLAEPCLHGLDTEGQQRLVRERFADAGGTAPRVLAALADSAEFYAEDVAQIKLPAYSAGRTVLLGDAGYCASPISGMGTSLSLVGAYVLAHELSTADTPEQAFTGYQERMRPYVRRAQRLPPGVPRVNVPRTRAGIRLFHTVMRLLTSRPVTRLSNRVGTVANDIELPDPPGGR